MKPSFAILVISLCVVSLSAQESEQTIPEALAAKGLQPGDTNESVVSKGSDCYIGCPSIEQTLARTDVAMIAIVGQPRAYLSDDQRDVFTDYTLDQRVVLYRREMSTFATDQPITVTAHGGTVTVNGIRYTLKHEALPPLPVGATCLFLLKHVGNRYHVADTYYGVFRVNDTLIPLVNDERFAPQYKSMAATAAIKDIAARLSARGPETLAQPLRRIS
jgi:hypothetical protein